MCERLLVGTSKRKKKKKKDVWFFKLSPRLGFPEAGPEAKISVQVVYLEGESRRNTRREGGSWDGPGNQ